MYFSVYRCRVEEGGCPFPFNLENVYLKICGATFFSVFFKTINYFISKGVFRIHTLLVS